VRCKQSGCLYYFGFLDILSRDNKSDMSQNCLYYPLRCSSSTYPIIPAQSFIPSEPASGAHRPPTSAAALPPSPPFLPSRSFFPSLRRRFWGADSDACPTARLLAQKGWELK